MSAIINLAGYRFADLSDLATLRSDLHQLCKHEQIRGTILISPEGINFFVAGTREAADQFLRRVRQIPGLADIDVKESQSAERPFNRLLVKIKREIIAFGVPGIAPQRHTSKRLSATELKTWLDEGRAFALLDTRNNFEVNAGTFTGAAAIGIDDFRSFPEAVRGLPDDWKFQPVVTFCTGGIRCEKATPYLEREGFQDVYQLDGGILKYFESCGNAHYEGDCFVFDKRVAVDATLSPSGRQQCYVCQAILTVEETSSPLFLEGVSCPQCAQTPAQAQAALLANRQMAIREATTPLPGSVPYDNVRPISVPGRLDGVTLIDFLVAMKTHLSREQWLEICAAGMLKQHGRVATPHQIVRSGERFLHNMPATREPDVSADIQVLHEDDAIVVINKPAPLPMHPCGRFHRNSLSSILDQVYHPLKLRPAHRLDADTSGVVVFSKSRAISRVLQPQFESGHPQKTYLARVQGHPPEARFECTVPVHHEPGAGGVRLPHEDGAPAQTRFMVLYRADDGTSLVRAEPLTGRTNQIRMHLWALGFPIVGDPIYLLQHQIGVAGTLAIDDGKLCLHAFSLQFEHPLTEETCQFEAPAPAWATPSFDAPAL